MRREERALLVGEGLDRVVHARPGHLTSTAERSCSSTRSSRACVLVDRHRLLEPHLDLAAVDLERRHLVVEPGAVAGHAPADAGVAHAGQPRERARDAARSRATSRSGSSGARSYRAGCGTASRRPARRALHPGAARIADLEQVGVVDVAGQRRRSRPAARRARPCPRPGTAPPAARTTPGTRPSAPCRPPGACSRPPARRPAPTRRRPPPRSKPPRSACRGPGATGARWRRAGGRSRPWRARRPSPTPRGRASSACPPRARARRASRSPRAACCRGRGSSSSACRASRGRP